MLWEDIGIPRPFITDPDPVTQIALRFLEAKQSLRVPDHPVDPDWDARRMNATSTLVSIAFHEISESYGSDLAAHLASWARRYLVDHSHWSPLTNWTFLFARIPYRGFETVERFRIPLSPAAAQTVLAAIQSYVPRDFSTALDKKIQEAFSIPLSSVESQYCASEFEPLDFIWDVGMLHRTNQVWEELRGTLTENEIEGVLAWGRAIAENINMPLEYVTLPPAS